MPQKYPKMSAVCNHPNLFNLSDYLSKVHGISVSDKRENIGCLKYFILLFRHMQCELIHPYHNQILHLHSLVTVFQETSSLAEQRKLPNPLPSNSMSDENEDELIQCLYDSRISYERVWGTSVLVMDYDIFKLHHPFSMLVAGPRGAGKSEFVKELLSLKRYIMTNPPERIVWFYGRRQPDLFCSLTQEIPSIEFYEGLPMNIKVMFDRSKRNICIIDDLMQSASSNQLVENLFTN